MPFVSRTRAILRRAEFGFFGETVRTIRQTPRFWGFPLSAGALLFFIMRARPLRTSWLIVGIVSSLLIEGVICMAQTRTIPTLEEADAALRHQKSVINANWQQKRPRRPALRAGPGGAPGTVDITTSIDAGPSHA
jgi:hypothetical protein